MDRAAYNECMKPFISGQHEDRKGDFCLGAKICSGKATNEEEAAKLCAEAAADPLKQTQSRKSKIDPARLASCISANIDIERLTVDNLPARLEVAINHCSKTRSASPPTYKRFMNSCLKEIGAGGDFINSQREIKECQTRWNKKRAA